MDTKQRVIRTALELFLRNGYDRTSMNQIAGYAGISKPAIYHHFENKNELFLEVLHFFFQQMRAWSISRFSSCTTLEDLLEAFFHSLQWFNDVTEIVLGRREESSAYSFLELFLSAGRMNPQVQEMMQAAFVETREQLERVLSKAQEKGEIRRDIDCRNLALQIHATIEGMAVISYLDKSVDFETAGEEIFRNLWTMLSPRI